MALHITLSQFLPHLQLDLWAIFDIKQNKEIEGHKNIPIITGNFELWNKPILFQYPFLPYEICKQPIYPTLNRKIYQNLKLTMIYDLTNWTMNSGSLMLIPSFAELFIMQQSFKFTLEFIDLAESTLKDLKVIDRFYCL